MVEATAATPIPLAIYGPAVPGWMNSANIAGGIVGLLVTVLLGTPRHNRLEKNPRSGASEGRMRRALEQCAQFFKHRRGRPRGSPSDCRCAAMRRASSNTGLQVYAKSARLPHEFDLHGDSSSPAR